jgi:hypothetical protein
VAKKSLLLLLLLRPAEPGSHGMLTALDSELVAPPLMSQT